MRANAFVVYLFNLVELISRLKKWITEAQAAKSDEKIDSPHISIGA